MPSRLPTVFKRDAKPALSEKNRNLVLLGGLTTLVLMVIIVVRILLRLDTETRLLEVLDPVLPEESKIAITKQDTPQFKALEWLSDRARFTTFSEDRIRQQYVMATLFYATNGHTWHNNTGWLENENECDWYSFKNTYACNDGVLKALDLSMNNLDGHLPADISILSNLEYLHFRSNKLSGPIPSSIGRLTNLVGTELYSNVLTGPIPSSIGLMTNLIGIEWYSNELTGQIPSSIGSLSNLVYLHLYDNKLTGPVPSTISQLTNLAELMLYNTSLTGSIPSKVCDSRFSTDIYVQCDNVTCECGDNCACQ